jgi:preprotein translocase subunit SecA
VAVEDWVKEDDIDNVIIAERIKEFVDKKLAEREKLAPEALKPMQKSILLQILDQTWKEHLLNLDYLRQGIVLRAYGQKDPLNEYRTEAFVMFQGMLDSLREKVTTAICMVELHAEAASAPAPKPKAVMSRGAANPFSQFSAPTPVDTPTFDSNNAATWANTPRNSACPCGSGKKYKYCHGQNAWE